MSDDAGMPMSIDLSEDTDEVDELIRLANPAMRMDSDDLDVDTPQALEAREKFRTTRDETMHPYVMAHLLRCPGILEKVESDLVKSEYFSADRQTEYLFNKARAILEKYGKVNKDAILADISSTYLAGNWDEAGLELLKIRLNGYYDVELNQPFAEDILRKALQDWREQRLRDAVKEREDLPKLQLLMEELSTDPLSVPQSQNMFDDLENMLNQSERFPSGISWFDNIMGGGAAAGEMIAIIAPSGGGKSTMAHQFLNEQVEMSIHCSYLSTEQKLAGDFSVRTAVLASKSGRSDWDNKKFSEVDPVIRARLMKMKPLHQEYFHFHDFVDASVTSMRTLMDPIYKLRDEGKCPKYVILDWWGPARDAFISSTGLSVSSDNKRMLQRLLLQRVSAMIKDLGVALLVFHQLSGQAAAKGAKAYQSSHDAQEDKNFNNYFDFAITLGKKDENDVVRVMMDKARRCENADIWLKLDGESCRFINADNPDESASAFERGAAPRSGGSTRGSADMWSPEAFN